MYEDLDEDLLVCEPCEVRWARISSRSCWVCSHPGQSWVLLPSNSEEQALVLIQRLRQFSNP